MAAKKQAEKARAAASSASPYVQRVVEDAELRDNVKVAFDNAKSAYGRMTNGKPAAKVLDDKKLHKELRQAAEALRDAGQALREGPQKKKSHGFAKFVLLVLISFGVALALSEDLRNKVLDLLFGAEEEFDYTTTPAPAPPAPAATGTG